MKYAGVGSRSTPDEVLAVMFRIAARLGKTGYTLRSGGADGADTAFENGAKSVSGNTEIFKANHATPEALDLAAKIHQAWFACTPYARKLHARNCMQVLGRRLDDPVDFVVCWTPFGKPVGGTRTAIKLAQSHNIPVYNLALPNGFRFAAKILNDLIEGINVSEPDNST